MISTNLSECNILIFCSNYLFSFIFDYYVTGILIIRLIFIIVTYICNSYFYGMTAFHFLSIKIILVTVFDKMIDKMIMQTENVKFTPCLI